LPTGGFELRIVEPDGAAPVERFNDSSNLARKRRALTDEPKNAGWAGPHDWNL
jgi:hypothetical protein